MARKLRGNIFLSRKQFMADIESQSAAMKIDNDVLESYLDCRRKAYLKLAQEQGRKSDYETLLAELRNDVKLNVINKILAQHVQHEVVQGTSLAPFVLKRGPLYLFDAILEDDLLSLCFDGLKKVPGASEFGNYHYIPIIFNAAAQVRKQHKILLEIYSLFLSKIQGSLSYAGIIWHGIDCKATKVHLNPDLRNMELLLKDLMEIREAKTTPEIILGEYCQFCEFLRLCHTQALQEDNISLLKGMALKEIKRLNRKGIFTVTQLSCTFLPRKQNKRSTSHTTSRYHALQAMAIRDRKIYVFGTPYLPVSPTRVYIDLEGDPDRTFVYLLGVIIDHEGTEQKYHFWGNKKSDEKLIFQQLIRLIAPYHQFTVFFYGSYEAAFLRRMRQEAPYKKPVDKVISNSLNILSVVYSHIYFPTYTNALKDVGSFLGCTWSERDATGIDSIVWRRRWEVNYDDSLKRRLIAYNSEDVHALRKVTKFIYDIIAIENSNSGTPHLVDGLEVAHAEGLGQHISRREYGKAAFILPDFEEINRCAYFDYQRAKILLRTKKPVRSTHSNKRRRKLPKPRLTHRIAIKSRKCVFCKSPALVRLPKKVHTKLAYDLKVSETGIKRQVIECTTQTHRCLNCGKLFLPTKYKRRDKHCHTLKSWAVYQHIAHRISLQQIEEMFQECFGLRVNSVELHMIKILMAKRYRSTYRSIMKRIVRGNVIHIDETQINIQRRKGYVWIFANWEEVVFLYRPTREGGFLQAMLEGFGGVFVSDF
jgi:predicted RecB family nuclease